MAQTHQPDAPNQEALFPKLSEDDIACIARYGEPVQVEEGVALFTEGEPADAFYLVIEGEVRVTKMVAGDQIVIALHTAGEFTGEVSLLNESLCIATGRTVTPCHLQKLGPEAFRAMLAACPSVADIILPAMAQRRPEAMALMQQREKLEALGKMSAGLAHELNNPAAAAQRAAGQMRDKLGALQTLALTLNTSDLDAESRTWLAQFARETMDAAIGSAALDTLARSDREDAVAEWLEQRVIPDPWCVAATLVDAGLDVPQLEDAAAHSSADALPDVLAWLEANLSAAALVREIEQSTARIAELVKAIKSYSYMDQGATQDVDIHAGLESTLTILGHKLKHTQIKVTREYDKTLPHLTAHGSELNQVWTNILDNAIDALGERGTILIRTSRENDCALVEIEDDGAGIPEDIQNRIFEPFFTTKDVGAGSGLGLDTSYRIIVQRHHGDICFDSMPGRTRFQVRLPLSTKDNA